MRVLFRPGQPDERHALAQTLKQGGQMAQHFGAFFACRLGRGSPEQFGGGALELLRAWVLGAMTQIGERQHLGPNLEEEVPQVVAHFERAQHLAQLDRVLNREGFLLLDLLRHAHQSLRAFALGQETGQELFEFVEHDAKHPPPRLGVLLDDLDDAPNLGLHHRPLHAAGIEAQHHGAHAVDQLPRRMFERAEEIGFSQGDAQHRHLQTRKPHAQTGRDPLLGQNGLKHERHHLDGGAFDVGRRFPLERRGLLAQHLADALHLLAARGGSARSLPGAAQGLEPLGGHRLVERARELRRSTRRLRRIELRPARNQQPLDLPQHALRLRPSPGERRGRGHQVCVVETLGHAAGVTLRRTTRCGAAPGATTGTGTTLRTGEPTTGRSRAAAAGSKAFGADATQ